jgi:hypothetical protein
LGTTDEPPVFTEPFLDAIVVENGESDRSFADTTGTDKSDGIEILDKANNPLD